MFIAGGSGICNPQNPEPPVFCFLPSPPVQRIRKRERFPALSPRTRASVKQRNDSAAMPDFTIGALAFGLDAASQKSIPPHAEGCPFQNYRSQYSFAPAGIRPSTISRLRPSCPSTSCTAEISMPQESMPIIFLGGRFVIAMQVLPTSSSGS